MTVTIGDLEQDTGEIYEALNNGTTAAASILSRAEVRVAKIAGTIADNDDVLRPLADAWICQQVIGSLDPVSKSIGNLSVGEKKIVQMRDGFIQDFKDGLRIIGKSSDGISIKFSQVNP